MELPARLASWLTPSAGPKPALPEPDARLALGALLVRVAKADKAYLFEELAEIDHVLARMNDLNALDAARMRANCERLEEALPDTPALVSLVRDTVAYSERIGVVEALWAVSLADGITQARELDVLRFVEEKLGLDADTAAAARARAEANH